eukprot:CAMPEP_0172446742 /NCGR_PEP_ID=MMETSP1065-20121228/6273_1 /TAXON_ID=265537 /ORGANISM="Amphiprora paludosa, Strain CCMP125" /LENGTH=532 /DNA_ID=CAMNT_0013197931 /DNA_START=293 /DNA_END=1891 /DNA_ORIENTATION=+
MTSAALSFREVGPTDLPACVALEKASYPEDEAASKSTLQYRQHQAATFFRCAILTGEDGDEDEDTVVGFICATRCISFKHESMTTHVAGGPLLAIHSVVVREEYRRRGIATAMLKEYIRHVQDFNRKADRKKNWSSPVQSIVLMAKANLLTFYIHTGFRVNRLSPILHGNDRWYELQQEIPIPRNHRCWVVDAFADPYQRGTGNPAAIVLMHEDTNTETKSTKAWMQTTAQEFNLSETAFIWRRRKDAEGEEIKIPGEQHYNIRYFTPSIEVPLCGHATLGSAAVLYQHTGAPSTDKIVFHATEDILEATLRPSNHFWRGQRNITISFPSKPATELSKESDRSSVLSTLAETFSIEEDEVFWMGLSDIGDLLVEIKTERFEALGYKGFRYDALLECDVYTRGVILCCRRPTSEDTNGGDAPAQPPQQQDQKDSSKEKVDFYSRFFAPKAGIDEDPVTGSAHCVLAPYFCSLLDKETVIGHQQSNRGGFVECTVVPPKESSSSSSSSTSSEDGGSGRVEITGLSVTTLGGRLQ